MRMVARCAADGVEGRLSITVQERGFADAQRLGVCSKSFEVSPWSLRVRPKRRRAYKVAQIMLSWECRRSWIGLCVWIFPRREIAVGRHHWVEACDLSFHSQRFTSGIGRTRPWDSPLDIRCPPLVDGRTVLCSARNDVVSKESNRTEQDRTGEDTGLNQSSRAAAEPEG